MPETTVDETDGNVLRKDQIWPSWQALIVQSIPDAAGVEGTTQDPLGMRLLPTDTRHHARPRLGIHNVRHSP